jgi:hypothetical protein
MKFTLLYDGPLPAQTTHDARVGHKHDIRTELHSQLVEVWKAKPVLAHYYEFLTARRELPPQERYADNVTGRPSAFMHRHVRGNFNFLPLVSAGNKLLCELDILFLRKEPAGSLFTTNAAGDLDNRLKVLFDALRIPKEAQELPAVANPTADQDPFMCLLENDDLITAVRLESERLYDANAHRDRVRLVINVTVKTQVYSWDTIDIAND